MVYKITAYDQNEQRLPGAAVKFSDQSGIELVTLITDSTGTIRFDDETDGDLLAPGVSVVISKDGYISSGGQAENLYQFTTFTLHKKPNAVPLVLGAVGFTALALYAFSTTKKGR